MIVAECRVQSRKLGRVDSRIPFTYAELSVLVDIALVLFVAGHALMFRHLQLANRPPNCRMSFGVRSNVEEDT